MHTVNVQFATGLEGAGQAARVAKGDKPQGASFQSVLDSVKSAAATEGKAATDGTAKNEPVSKKNTADAKDAAPRAAKQDAPGQIKEAAELPPEEAVAQATESTAPQETAPAEEQKPLPQKERAARTEATPEEPQVTFILEAAGIMAPLAEAAVLPADAAAGEPQAFGSDTAAIAAAAAPVTEGSSPLEAEELSLAAAATPAPATAAQAQSAKAESEPVLSEPPAAPHLAAETAAATAQESLSRAPSEPHGETDAGQEALLAQEAAPARQGLFTIIDERTEPEQKLSVQAEEAPEKRADSTENALADAGFAARTAQQDILSTDNQSAGATGSTFQQMLSQQIQQNAPEFVKAGSIVLRDSDRGSINLVMRPETLGNVKISMEVSDKIIAGHITVQSREALEAFRQNLETLRQAFQQNGFENANFTLSLSDSSLGNGAFAQGQNAGEQFLADKTYARFAQSGEPEETGSAEPSSTYASGGEYQIDVVA